MMEGSLEQQFLDPGILAGDRWRRMLLRSLARFDWSREGVRLWCVKHPELRWLPFPYPSVSSVEQWRLQLDGMVASGCYPKRWVGRGRFTSTTLASMSWLRGRVGLKFAFLEDPVLSGMLASRQQPGRMNRIRTAAIREEAAAMAKESDRLKVARALLGPKGWLPTLKGDLVKLAALWHTPLEEKDTVKTIEDKLRPLLVDLCHKVPYTPAAASTASSASFAEHYDLTKSPTMAAAPRPSTLTSFGTMSPGPNPASTTSPVAAEDHLNVATLNTHLMNVMDQRFKELGERHEAMLTQVLQHMMQLQTNLRGAEPDHEMGDGWTLTQDTPQADPRLEQLGCLENRDL